MKPATSSTSKVIRLSIPYMRREGDSPEKSQEDHNKKIQKVLKILDEASNTFNQ